MSTPKNSTKKVCAVTGCGRPVQTGGMNARAAEIEGLCREHYLEAQAAKNAALDRPTL